MKKELGNLQEFTVLQADKKLNIDVSSTCQCCNLLNPSLANQMVPAHIKIIENYKAKQSIDVPGMTTRLPPHTDYYLTIRRTRNSKWQKE